MGTTLTELVLSEPNVERGCYTFPAVSSKHGSNEQRHKIAPECVDKRLLPDSQSDWMPHTQRNNLQVSSHTHSHLAVGNCAKGSLSPTMIGDA